MKMQRRKVITAGFLLALFPVWCYAQTITIKGSTEKKPLTTAQIGASYEVSDNFQNGDFQQSAQYETAVASNPLFNPPYALRANEQALVDFFKKPLLLHPWRARGDVKLVHEGDNILVQLNLAKGVEASLSQDIKLRDKNARIEFDLFGTGGAPSGVFEVAILDASGRFPIATYSASTISSQKHCVINLSGNKNLMARKAGDTLTVEFSLRGKEQDSATVRLDSVVIM
ncbi:MAG: hypothetical protein KKF80_06380 [Candidatus Omnitrophica bacterium]|nr:hypothetical protein [Candidatus Omnitrophota bacterium]